MKARITHPDGTTVDIEGTPDEVARFVATPRQAPHGAWPPAGWLPLSGDVTVDRYESRTGDVTCTSWELVERAVAS